MISTCVCSSEQCHQKHPASAAVQKQLHGNSLLALKQAEAF
jgi:hypothetical protein